VNTYQALKALNVKPDSSWDEIKTAYRKLALEFHPDKNIGEKEGNEFKKVTEAYNHLKKNFDSNNQESKQNTKSDYKTDFGKKTQWGAPKGEKIPEQDWSKYTREFEEGDPTFWREYEKKFWEDYNARIRSDGRHGEYEKAKEPKVQPNIKVDVSHVAVAK